MRKSLTFVFVALAVGISALPIVATYLYSPSIQKFVQKEIYAQLQDATLASTANVNADIFRMCEIISTADKKFTDLVKSAMLHELNSIGKPSLEEIEKEREVRSQTDSQERRTTKVRLLKFGDAVVDCADAENKDSPFNKILQNLKNRLNCDFTIFVRMNPDGDLLRLASTYTDSNGENIAGSYIPSRSNSLKREGVVETLLAKSEYSGLASTTSGTILINYIPLTNDAGNVIGAVFFGTKKNLVDELGKYISTLNTDKTYSIRIIDNSSPDNPVLKISDNRDNDTTSLNDEISNIKKNIAYEIIEKSIVLKRGQIGHEIIETSRSDNRKIIIAYSYYKPWDWIITTISETGDAYATSANIAKFFDIDIEQTLKFIFFFGIITAIICFLATRKYVTSLKHLVAVFKQAEVNPLAPQKIIRSLTSKKKFPVEFNYIRNNLQDILKRTEQSLLDIVNNTSRLLNVSAQIDGISEQINELNSAELLQMKEISTANNSIVESSQMLEKTAEASALEIQKALKLNRQSQNAIDLLLRKYETLSLASNNVAKRLAMINENAEKITGLITTISDVSLKTNLLSLNASIEAEKVGEMGLGFAVVSHQIRMLAEKTSKVSTDIEKTVIQMQSSINASIMEMDKFSANMRLNSNLTVETAKKLSTSISNIETIEPKFENISRRITSLAETAIYITNAIKTITRETSQTKIDVEDISASNKKAKTKTSTISNSAKKI